MKKQKSKPITAKNINDVISFMKDRGIKAKTIATRDYTGDIYEYMEKLTDQEKIKKARSL